VPSFRSALSREYMFVFGITPQISVNTLSPDSILILVHRLKHMESPLEVPLKRNGANPMLAAIALKYNPMRGCEV
jgi:hypothetical protein